MKKAAALVALALAAVALVACGGDAGDGDSDRTDGGPGRPLKFRADPGGDPAFTKTEVSAEAGKVKVEFENPQRDIHDLTIEDSGGKQVGQTYVLSEAWDSTFVKLKPGTYTFYCSVEGHRKAGMEGTLTVE